MRKRLIFFIAGIIAICSASFAETTDPRFPAGTMGEPEGTVAVVSIYADDARFTWDLDRKKDQQAFQNAYEYLGIATEYLTKQIGKYGKKIRFVWDWEEHEELAYSAAFSTNLGNSINDSSAGVFEADEIISETIDTDAILKSTGADNIIYMFFINSDGSESHYSCSFWAGIDPADSQKDYYYALEKLGDKPEPYEYCFIFMGRATAGMVAHEMIHPFAVPDLYGESNFGVTEELANYLEKINLNDIMQGTDERQKNKISENITDITAYYMGLIDHCDLVQKFNLKPSTHTNSYTESMKMPETNFVEIPIFDPVSGTVTFFDESKAAGGGEAPQESIFESQLMGGKQIPIESPVLTITDEDGDEDNIFPITLDFSVKGNNALKISAVLNFDDDLMEEEQFETPKVKKSLNKITYSGIAYGITFDVIGTKGKGKLDSSEEEILMQAYKATTNYAITLLNVLMEE